MKAKVSMALMPGNRECMIWRTCQTTMPKSTRMATTSSATVTALAARSMGAR